MKKLIALSLLLLSATGAAFAGYSDDGNINRKEQSGASAADPVRVYQLVRNSIVLPDQASISQGDVVIWDIVSDDGVSISLVDIGGQPTASNDAVAGVVVSRTIPTADAVRTAVNDIGRRNWGYIQTYGLNAHAHVDPTEGACTAPAGLRASGVAGYATCVPAAASNVGGGATLGFVYDTVSAPSEDVEVFVRTR